MRARLFARFGPEAGLEVEFGDEATIGRGKENRVLLSSPEVSQRHARVFFEADSAAYWVEDLDSLNGTRLDGEPVSGRRRLGELHVLGFGDAVELFFLELDREPGETAELEPEAVETTGRRTRVDAEVPTLPAGLRPKTAAPDATAGSITRVEETPAELPAGLAADTAAAVPASQATFVLEVSGAGGGRFELRQGENLIGRSGRAQVTLTNRELSRRHATFRVEGDRIWLRDEGSRNHTFVAGEQISEEVELAAGSELRFGRLVARLTAAAEAGGSEAE